MAGKEGKCPWGGERGMKVIADDSLICVGSCLFMVYMTAVGLWRYYDWGRCWPR